MSGIYTLKCYLDRTYNRTRVNLELLSLQRIIAHDVRAATPDVKNWYTIPYTIWQQDDDNDAAAWVGYELRNKKLLRHEGDFDTITKTWQHKKTSVIAQDIHTFEVNLVLSGNDELCLQCQLVDAVQIALSIQMGEVLREERLAFYPYQCIRSAVFS